MKIKLLIEPCSAAVSSKLLLFKMASDMTSLLPSVQEIAKNSNEEVLEVVEILLKFANNIISDPKNEKYRRIRVGNPVVMDKLMPVSGAVQCLFEMGFTEVSIGALSWHDSAKFHSVSTYFDSDVIDIDIGQNANNSETSMGIKNVKCVKLLSDI